MSFEDDSDEMEDAEYIDDKVEEGMKGVGSSDDEWEDMDDGEQVMATDGKQTDKQETKVEAQE